LYFGIFIREAANAIRAGLIGNCYTGWLFVPLLWVHADQRRIGIGSQLMAEADAPRHRRADRRYRSQCDAYGP
jgi:GNAT superfamily N-acetyltransferase